MEPDEKALVVLESAGANSWETLSQAVKSFAPTCRVDAISSVYELDDPDRLGRETAAGGHYLVAGVLVSVSVNAEKLLQTIETIQSLPGVRVWLVAHGSRFRMTPAVTLPHPDLHELPHWLQVASEVWGDYKHPVLRATILELNTRFPSKDWGHFHSQGQALIDF